VNDGPDARARLFVAFELGADVRAALSAWAREELGAEAGARLLDADSLHMTLCFLGSVLISAVAEISAVLASDVCRGGIEHPPTFEVEGVRWLPPRRPRVCAVSLHDVGGRGRSLQGALSERLAAGGWYEPERRGWLAHVTVARMSRGGRSGGPGSAGGSVAPPVGSVAPPPLAPFPATAIVLMRSWPGSRYEVLARVVL
jgi:RNA 2',3'-cyclic 3'-phosphodiesterase